MIIYSVLLHASPENKLKNPMYHPDNAFVIGIDIHIHTHTLLLMTRIATHLHILTFTHRPNTSPLSVFLPGRSII
jgi:hypothetical protein